MNFVFILLWCAYAFLLVSLARWARGKDHLLPGRVGSAVQALAYVATYVSAVALVGFGGLCHRYGLQMLLIAAGNIWFGTWFVYRYLAWPTRLWQRRLNAKTPGALLGAAIGSNSFRVFAGLFDRRSPGRLRLRRFQGGRDDALGSDAAAVFRFPLDPGSHRGPERHLGRA